MSLYTPKNLLIAFVAVGAIAYVAAFKEFDVNVVGGEVMCPIKVEMNDDPKRTPRLIEYLKCADQPNPVCKEKNMPDGCCRNNHNWYHTECVEIYDFMDVLFEGTEEPTRIKVPMGCNCLINEVVEVKEVDRAALNDTEVI